MAQPRQHLFPQRIRRGLLSSTDATLAEPERRERNITICANWIKIRPFDVATLKIHACFTWDYDTFDTHRKLFDRLVSPSLRNAEERSTKLCSLTFNIFTSVSSRLACNHLWFIDLCKQMWLAYHRSMQTDVAYISQVYANRCGLHITDLGNEPQGLSDRWSLWGCQMYPPPYECLRKFVFNEVLLFFSCSSTDMPSGTRIRYSQLCFLRCSQTVFLPLKIARCLSDCDAWRKNIVWSIISWVVEMCRFWFLSIL